MDKYSSRDSFKATSLYASLMEKPFGFVDVGAAGGMHPLIQPLSDLTACVGFEPDSAAYNELLRNADNSPFSQLRIFDVAISGKQAKQPLYITKSSVCISLLKPGEEVTTRYGMHGFDLVGTGMVKTDTMDNLFARNDDIHAEFIKLDCQGMAYDILKGAKNTLKNQCVALQVETEFFTFYNNQKLFHETNSYLQKNGFQLYGLYPHYISTKKIDRKQYDSQERIAWADAIYFKDPLAQGGNVSLNKRSIEALIISAMLMKFYDFSIELAEKYYADDRQDMGLIVDFIHDLAASDRNFLENELHNLIKMTSASPDKIYILARKFIDRNKANCDLDFIKL